ncbi:hypothetical protein M231_02708 [Tremella mesenterica]|uniref:Chromatin modification-related protein EAF6 n=1 Tax=Tremella mesenterica TaxID=5217 RepID=A0A4Q1BQ69_TREME|nr:hypothetical protein M231_02708 [Tremella mesenterica]
MSQSGPPADAKQAHAAVLAEAEAAIKRKRAIDTALANIENAIHDYEGNYLMRSAALGGNIIRGFDNVLKQPTAALNKKKVDQVTEADRLFSNSSSTFQQSIAAKQQLESNLAAQHSLFPRKGGHTPLLRPNLHPTSTFTQISPSFGFGTPRITQSFFPNTKPAGTTIHPPTANVPATIRLTSRTPAPANVGPSSSGATAVDEDAVIMEQFVADTPGSSTSASTFVPDANDNAQKKPQPVRKTSSVTNRSKSRRG